MAAGPRPLARALSPAPAGNGTRRGVSLPSHGRDGGADCRRAIACGRARRRAARLRQRHADPRVDSPDMGLGSHRAPVPGRAGCDTGNAAQPRLYVRCGPHPRSRHRRKHDGVHDRQRRDPGASRRRTESHRAGRRARRVAAPSARITPRARSLALRLDVGRHRRLQPDDGHSQRERPVARTRGRRLRVRRHVRSSRPAPGPGSRVPAGGRSSWRTGGGAARGGSVAQPLQRRSVDSRPLDHRQ